MIDLRTSLDETLITHELASRKARTPDFQAQNRALAVLAETLGGGYAEDRSRCSPARRPMGRSLEIVGRRKGVKEQIGRFGGTVDIASTHGQGTRVCVRVPLARPLDGD